MHMGEDVKGTKETWSNTSVLKFAGSRDPVEAVLQAAREAVLEGIDKGWTGPPFDPMKLAELRGIILSPCGDIRDARILPLRQSRFQIEYNPNRPSGRIRYSIAHEIAHTFFPDCGERIRNRGKSLETDEAQLEALCNIAAAEILMPIGSLSGEEIGSLKIEKVSDLRKRFDVSTEAVLIRLAHLSQEPCSMFVASRWTTSRHQNNYRLDYSIPTRSWAHPLSRGTKFPEQSPVAECTAIGFTSSGQVELPDVQGKFHVECMGIAPYPGALFPRVAGFICSRKRGTTAGIRYVKGDALQPRAEGRKIIAHVVSDSTPNWGGRGFAIALKKKWASAQEDFRMWASAGGRLQLGNVRFFAVEEGIEVATMVCQRGYGPSVTPRIRYAALETALQSISVRADSHGASVHMPRIGCGQAGGSWMLVEELIAATLLESKIPVTVYDLPEQSDRIKGQMSLTLYAK